MPVSKVSVERLQGEADWHTWNEMFKAALSLNDGERCLGMMEVAEARLDEGVSAVEAIQQEWEGIDEERRATGKAL